MYKNYIDCAIEHFEERVGRIDTRLWEVELLAKLKQIQEQATEEVDQ